MSSMFELDVYNRVGGSPQEPTNRSIDADNSILLRLIPWYVLACCLAFAVLATLKAYPNWDMLGYIASIKSLSADNAEQLHAEIYAGAKAYLSDAEYHELINKDSYRQTMAQNPELFELQIPYYQIRWLFLALIAALGAVGINPFLAGHIVASVSAALAGFILFKAFQRSVAPVLWLVFPLLFALSGALETARMYSPDAMALLVFALAFYTFRYQHWLFFVVIALAVFVRTDLIVLVALSSVLCIALRPKLSLPAILSFLVAGGFYLLINSVTGNHGWAAVHYYVFESNMQATDPRVFSDHVLTIAQYFGAILRNLPNVFFYPPLLLFVASMIISVYLVYILASNASSSDKIRGAYQSGTWVSIWSLINNDPRAVALILGVLYLIAHFVLFPLLDTRFFAGPYLIGLLCCLSYLSQLAERHQISR